MKIHPKLKDYIWLLIPIILFIPSVFFDFAVDDYTLIVNNPFQNIWTKFHANQYCPLVYTIWQFLISIAGKVPSIFHLTNLLVHICSVYLVYSMLKRLGISDGTSKLAALLFAIHPLQVESVVNCANLKHLLATAFSLASIRIQLSRVRFKAIISAILFALGLLSMPSACMAPVVSFVLLTVFMRTGLKHSLLTVSVCFGSLLIYALAFNQRIFHKYILSVLESLGVGVFNIIFYSWKLIVPFPLTIDYGWSPIHIVSSTWFPLTFIIGTLMAVAFLYFKKRLSFSLLIAIICMVPTLGFVPYFHQYISNVSDRFVYFSMFGVALFIGLLLDKYHKQLKYYPVIILCIFGALSFKQQFYWVSNDVIFPYGHNENSTNSLHIMYKHYLDNKKPKLAMKYLKKLADNKVKDSDLYLRTGRVGLAVDTLLDVTKLYELHPEAHKNLSRLYLILSKMESFHFETFKQSIDSEKGMELKGYNLGISEDKNGIRIFYTK